MRQFDAAFARPYFTDYLNIELASIWLGAKGDVAIATTPKTTVRREGFELKKIMIMLINMDIN